MRFIYPYLGDFLTAICTLWANAHMRIQPISNGKIEDGALTLHRIKDELHRRRDFFMGRHPFSLRSPGSTSGVEGYSM